MTTKNSWPSSAHAQADQCPSCGSFCNILRDLDEQDYCNDCRPESAETKLAEVLGQFNNGETRYAEDPNFKEAVDSLRAGIGVYAVLDKTLNQLRVLTELHKKTRERAKGLEIAMELQASGLSYEDQLKVIAKVKERLTS